MAKMYTLALSQYDEEGNSHVMMWPLANALQYEEQAKICREYLGNPVESFLTAEGLDRGMEAVETDMVVYQPEYLCGDGEDE